MKPLFSIILTTYNREQFLPRAIQSVLQQNFPDFELIIVDDHSTDSTPHVVAKFNDARITYIRQTHNQGVSTARNTAIQQAKADYLCFLDDDDEYCPEYLQEISQFLKKRNEPFVGLIWTGIAFIYTPNNLENGKEMITLQQWDLEKEKDLFFLTNIAFVKAVFHRLCFERAGLFNPKLHFAEDMDLVFRMLAMDIPYTSIPKLLIKMHVHEHVSLSRSISKKEIIEHRERFLERYDRFLQKHVSLWINFYTNLVGEYYHAGKKQRARKLVLQILKKKWFYPKIWEMFLRFELLKPLKFTLFPST